MKKTVEEVLSGIYHIDSYNLSFDDIEKQVIDKDIINFSFEVLKDITSERDENVFKDYCINQYNQKELSEKYSVSQTRISQIIIKIQMYLRYYLKLFYHQNEKYIEVHKRYKLEKMQMKTKLTKRKE